MKQFKCVVLVIVLMVLLPISVTAVRRYPADGYIKGASIPANGAVTIPRGSNTLNLDQAYVVYSGEE